MDRECLEKLLEISDGKRQPKGLTEITINELSDYCYKNFNCYLPSDYKRFLSIMNGYSFDDYKIFCCYNDDIEQHFPRYSNLDFVTFNIRFYKNTDITDYLILGKTSINYLGYCKSSHKYIIIDNGVMQRIEEYDNFWDLILGVFSNNTKIKDL